MAMTQPTWLTCDLVEELQQAVEAGRSMATFVDTLEAATLPGVLEYGCAKWHCKTLPELPTKISETAVGKALQEVKCDLGLRRSGNQKVPPRSMTPHRNEFFVLEGEDSTVHRDWKEYLVRFRQSAKCVGFSLDQAKGLAAAFGEMADNAALHSSAPVGVLVGYQTSRGTVVCCAVDVGVGVLASLRSHEAYQRLDTHQQALRVAFRKGESRYGPGRGGLGFYRVFKSLTEMWGTLRFRSGEACVTMDGRHCDFHSGEDLYVLFRPGFQVTICCRVSDRADEFPLV